MQTQSRISAFVRWVLSWPVLVILALNLENTASQAGYGSVINQHWKQASPMLRGIYDFATAGYVLYPALILTGAVLYEWIGYTSTRMEADGSVYQRWLIATNADAYATAFFGPGFTRRSIRPNRDLVKMNKRLAGFAMPLVPETFDHDDETNALYGSYLSLIAKGQWHHAKSFIESANLGSDD